MPSMFSVDDIGSPTLRDSNTQLPSPLDFLEFDSEEAEKLRTTNLLIFKQIVEGLLHIHDQNVVHRDIKPDNVTNVLQIFVDENCHVFVGDFGLAKSLSVNAMPEFDIVGGTVEDSAEASTDEGTFFYMAPELLSRQVYTAKSDIYSLGVILFELFYPFATEMERIVSLTNLKKNPLSLYQYCTSPAIPPDISKMLSRLLSNDPSNRPSALEILLDPLFDNFSPISMTLTSPAESPMRSSTVSMNYLTIRRPSASFSFRPGSFLSEQHQQYMKQRASCASSSTMSAMSASLGTANRWSTNSGEAHYGIFGKNLPRLSQQTQQLSLSYATTVPTFRFPPASVPATSTPATPATTSPPPSSPSGQPEDIKSEGIESGKKDVRAVQSSTSLLAPPKIVPPSVAATSSETTTDASLLPHFLNFEFAAATTAPAPRQRHKSGGSTSNGSSCNEVIDDDQTEMFENTEQKQEQQSHGKSRNDGAFNGGKLTAAVDVLPNFSNFARYGSSSSSSSSNNNSSSNSLEMVDSAGTYLTQQYQPNNAFSHFWGMIKSATVMQWSPTTSEGLGPGDRRSKGNDSFEKTEVSSSLSLLSPSSSALSLSQQPPVLSMAVSRRNSSKLSTAPSRQKMRQSDSSLSLATSICSDFSFASSSIQSELSQRTVQKIAANNSRYTSFANEKRKSFVAVPLDVAKIANGGGVGVKEQTNVTALSSVSFSAKTGSEINEVDDGETTRINELENDVSVLLRQLAEMQEKQRVMEVELALRGVQVVSDNDDDDDDDNYDGY
ncbi:hypothetical protein HK100_005941 [Physocladia obscura]|uniref:Protein kinase domain-containing protein n=1 Tax=Physocladia obscura TaxID=109957 RepID=A0AAD5T6A7_9FUNG|nr:hypothetical protein HK100_005941 [Physocladia obscura]